MRPLVWHLGISLGTVLGCAPDNSLHRDPAGEDYAARLLVSPSELDFGALEYGDTSIRTVQLSNVGNATLYVESMEIARSGAFTVLGADEEIVLDIGEEVSVDLVYTSQREDDEGALVIQSTDPGQPEVSIPLYGAGLFPSLELSPGTYDLGEHLTDCGAVRGELTLKNVGLGVATVDLIAVTGGVFRLVEPTSLPLTLGPDEEIPVVIEAEAGVDGEWSGAVHVSSDDPNSPVGAELSAVTGTWSNVETFHQGSWAMTDVVLTVDRSCSMEDDTARLSTELPTLFSALDETGTDFQIAVVTEDNGCHNETLFSPRTEGAEDLFREAVFGWAGSYTEAGFTLAHHALTRVDDGECNDGLLREGARVSVVHLSDEPEQSSGSTSSWIEDILALAPTATLSAVAGPVPGGCATAEAGQGYDQAAEATGGFFVNFCEVDWSEVALELANLSVGHEVSDTFTLAEEAWEPTIVVLLDGEVTEDWTYDEATNSVVFDELPAEGSDIEISYDYGECDQVAE